MRSPPIWGNQTKLVLILWSRKFFEETDFWLRLRELQIIDCKTHLNKRSSRTPIGPDLVSKFSIWISSKSSSLKFTSSNTGDDAIDAPAIVYKVDKAAWLINIQLNINSICTEYSLKCSPNNIARLAKSFGQNSSQFSALKRCLNSSMEIKEVCGKIKERGRLIVEHFLSLWPWRGKVEHT